MAIFGRPNFQGDFNSLFPQGNSAAGATDDQGGMPAGPSWLGNPIQFLLSALQQNQGTTPGGGVPGILGGLGRGAPTGPGVPAFTTPVVNMDPTGSSGITPSTPPGGGVGTPPRPPPPRVGAPPSPIDLSALTRLPGMPGMPPQAEGGQPAGAPLPRLPDIGSVLSGGGTPASGAIGDPMSGLMPDRLSTATPSTAKSVAAPAAAKEEPFRDPMTGLVVGEDKNIADRPIEQQSPFERDIRGLVGTPSKKFGESASAAKTALERYFSVPPGSAAGFGDWTPTPEPEGATGEPAKPPAPFSKAMPAKSGYTTPGRGGTIEVPGGGTAAPEARIKITPEQKRDMVWTVLGEAGDEPQKGKEAVAHVIINRTLQNKAEFGGNDVSSVIKKPYQFEPWNTAAGRARMAGYPPTSKDYKDAEKAVDDAVSGKADPTGGSTFFYSPVGQAALGRAKPNWATQDRFATKIGGHAFYYGTSGTPLPPPAGAEEGAVTEPASATPDTSGRVTPQPAMYPMPPGQAQTPKTDFSGVRAMLDKAGYVTPGENMANVLAGLARGAGSVASNSPGSFAAALAAAGAGGEGAFGAGLKEGRQAIGARAAAEIPLLGTEHEQAKDYTQVAYQNATAKYNTVLQNLNNDFTGRKQEFSFLQPDIKYDANGMHVVRYNKDTGQYEATNIPLRDKLQQYESTAAIIKSLGADHPWSRIVAGQNYIDALPEDLKGAGMKELAVQDVIAMNAGGSVFKEAWTAALKKAEKQIPPEMRSKPAEYEAERNAIAASIIKNDPSINNPAWLADAARSGSPWAAVMLQSLKAQAATQQQQRAQVPDAGY